MFYSVYPSNAARFDTVFSRTIQDNISGFNRLRCRADVMGKMEIFGVLVLLLLFSSGGVDSSTFESDVTALTSMSRGFKANLGWNGDDPCGTRWTGVTCNVYNVTKLMLNNVNLEGRLAASVGNLANLQHLDLSFNSGLTGPLPASLGQLTNLELLNLQSCGFTGSIPPELGGLKKLKFLALNLNKLSGVIPPELGGLSSVYWFDLAQNQITGPLPVSTATQQKIGLDNLTEALHFHLNDNQLSGSFPSEICILPKLIHLLLDHNNFAGKVPEEVGNFSSLVIMRLDFNKFNGAIPSTINKVKTLTEIHTNDNAFTGKLPDFTPLTAIRLVALSNNQFDAQPLPSFTALDKLQTVEINKANLNGNISNDFFQLPSLESVSLKTNKINGVVNFLGVSPSLFEVYLDDNDITDVAGVNNDFKLSLSGNPACESNRLAASICAITPVSTWRPNITCEVEVPCGDGKTVNQNTCFCAFPIKITFRFNAPAFSGVNQTRIDILRDALFTGLKLTSRDQVWVEGTNFTSDNRLFASVLIFPPKGNENLPPEDLSFILNQISTHQVHQLDYFGPYSLAVSPPREAGGKGSKGVSAGLIAGVVIAVLIGAVVVALVSVYALRQKRRADKAAVVSNPFASWGSHGKDSGSAPQLKGARFFSVGDLKRATNNFSSDNEIGSGGYGKVYRGTLITGEEVAIKRAQEGSLQGASEFKTEIELLSRVHHRNLVGLIGFCYESGEQMLVYEYMANGTIREHLPDYTQKLSWRKRLEIAIGSAKGIAYLHELANPPIIHRDIKSSNILLDEKYVAKVADFGLSKLAPPTDGKGHVSTQVKGTLGYLDPEYYMTQQLTEKSDVYSFGVVLLELITAKQPIENGKYIVREVRAALERGGFMHLQHMLDPYLRDYPRDDLERFVDIALSCVHDSATERPTMNEVVKELEVLLSHISSAGFSREPSSNRSTPVRSVYDDPSRVPKSDDPSFQYSGGFPHAVEPK